MNGTQAPVRGIDGRTVRFSDNAVVLVNNKVWI
jgi:ribosomal protein L14